MKVVIEKSNGEKLTITGTPEEIALLLKAREEQEARQAGAVVDALRRIAEDSRQRQAPYWDPSVVPNPINPSYPGVGTGRFWWQVGQLTCDQGTQDIKLLPRDSKAWDL